VAGVTALTFRDDRWAAIGVKRPPILAPPYAMFPAGPSRIWLSRYGAWSTKELDARWVLDSTQMPVGKSGALPRVGDLIVWVGDLAYRDGEIREVLFPPSLVISVGPRRRGMSTVESIRDTWLLEVETALAAEAGSILKSHLSRLTSRHGVEVSAEFLDVWGINVVCPNCGCLGTPASWGLTAEEPCSRDRNGAIRPWPTGVARDLGCSPVGPGSYYACPRCGDEWGDEPIADPMVWPESHDPSGDPMIVGSVQDILEAVADIYDHKTPAEGLAEVAEWIFNFTEPYEVDLRQDSPDGIVMTVRYWGIDLVFPFDLNALPAMALDLEGDCRAMEADWDYLECIEDIEGLVLERPDSAGYAFDPWHWRDHGFGSYDPTYAYVRKAPESWTIKEWFERRVRGDGIRAFTAFAVPVGNWSTTTLKEVRELSKAAKEAEHEENT
jgi:hypothetical protein